MEAAYDHIQEEVLNSDEKKKPAENKEATQEGSLNTDLQDAYRSFSSSAWGVKLGGFLGSVRKQGESYYQSARDEASVASEEALKGFTDLKSSLVSRTRGLSLGSASPPPNPSQPLEPVDATAPAVPSTDGATTSRDAAPDATSPDSEGFITRFRAEADKRLKEIQRAEDAADEALLKFGTNIRNFLRDAVTIAPPSFDDDELTSGQGATQGGEPQGGKVLFESKDAEGRRVIHTTRLDAQLHVIHCSLDSFTKDPASPQWEAWRKEFEVGTRTEEIAADLEKYEELRRAMERLVPDKVTYEAFWARYYFLRMVIASEEQRRKEMLKGKPITPSISAYQLWLLVLILWYNGRRCPR